MMPVMADVPVCNFLSEHGPAGPQLVQKVSVPWKTCRLAIINQSKIGCQEKSGEKYGYKKDNATRQAINPPWGKMLVFLEKT